jgi:hypothetical protein
MRPFLLSNCNGSLCGLSSRRSLGLTWLLWLLNHFIYGAIRGEQNPEMRFVQSRKYWIIKSRNVLAF